MAALRSVLAIVAELGQLVIEGLDGGFLLAKDFLYQLVAMGFERLLLGEEFIDRIVGHVEYDAIAGLWPVQDRSANDDRNQDDLLWRCCRRFSLHVVNAVRGRAALPCRHGVGEGFWKWGARRRSLPRALEGAVCAVLNPELLSAFAVL
jgi:hypothetical protein